MVQVAERLVSHSEPLPPESLVELSLLLRTPIDDEPTDEEPVTANFDLPSSLNLVAQPELLDPYYLLSPPEVFRQRAKKQERTALQELKYLAPGLLEAAQHRPTKQFQYDEGNSSAFQTHYLNDKTVQFEFRQKDISHKLQLQFDAKNRPHFSLFKTRHTPRQRFTRRIDFRRKVDQKYISLVDQLMSFALSERSDNIFWGRLTATFFHHHDHLFTNQTRLTVPSPDPENHRLIVLEFQQPSTNARRITYQETVTDQVKLVDRVKHTVSLSLHEDAEARRHQLVIDDRLTTFKSTPSGTAELVTTKLYQFLIDDRHKTQGLYLEDQELAMRYLDKLESLLSRPHQIISLPPSR